MIEQSVEIFLFNRRANPLMWKCFGTKKKGGYGRLAVLGRSEQGCSGLIIFLMRHCYFSAFVAKVVADTATGDGV